MGSIFDFDLLVVGSGPGGQSAALTAAQKGQKVGMVERKPYIGGVSLQTGTIPSKAIREVSYFVSRFSSRGMREMLTRGTYSEATFLSDVISKKDSLIDCKESDALGRLMKKGVTLMPGEASFHDANTMKVKASNGREDFVRAKNIVLATGSRPRRPADVPFDREHILDSTGLLNLSRLPESLIVVGGGVIASEFATIFAPLGVKVTVVDKHKRMLSFLDSEIAGLITERMLDLGISLVMNSNVKRIEKEGSGVCLETEDGRTFRSSHLLYAMGREPNYGSLDIDKAGLSFDDKGWVQVNEFFQAEGVPNIYVVGDLSGRLALASTAMEQGRIAACHSCGCCSINNPAPVPMAIYTVPEVACVGPTEEELRSHGIDYVAGRAGFAETARGQIIGERTGMLKILAERAGGRLLAVHILGESASELVHVGQTLIGCGANLETVSAQIFNYPTLAECYTLAAQDGLQQVMSSSS